MTYYMYERLLRSNSKLGGQLSVIDSSKTKERNHKFEFVIAKISFNRANTLQFSFGECRHCHVTFPALFLAWPRTAGQFAFEKDFKTIILGAAIYSTCVVYTKTLG